MIQCYPKNKAEENHKSNSILQAYRVDNIVPTDVHSEALVLHSVAYRYILNTLPMHSDIEAYW